MTAKEKSKGITELLKGKDYPKFIADHKIFKELDSLNKIFPKLGLHNGEEEIVIDNMQNVEVFAYGLIQKIASVMQRRIINLRKFTGEKKLSSKRKENSKVIISYLKQISNLAKNPKAFLTPVKGRLTLNVPDDLIIGEKVAYKKGYRLFSAYGKINDLLKESKFAVMPELDSLIEFKTFSAENIPNNKLRVAFSSDGAEGLWDIATMSERGITSCQSWQGDYRKCVIGSMVDPFVGIIYLTTGNKFNDRGSKMIRRCIVRFVIDKADKKPYIFMDNMYPSMDKAVLTAFKQFISKRVGENMKIIANSEISNKLLQNSYIPNSPVSQLLQKLQDSGKKKGYYADPYYKDEDQEYYPNDRNGIMSYQDTYIPVSKKHKKTHLKDLSKKKSELYNEFYKNINAICGKIKLSQFKKELRPALKATLDYYRYEFVNIYNDLSSLALNKSYEESFDVPSFTRNYYKFILFEKDKVINQHKRRTIANINSSFRDKADKFKTAHFNAVIEVIQNNLTSLIKRDMMKAYKTKVKPLPLP